MNVGSVDHAIGIAEPFAERTPDVDRNDLARIDRVHERQAIDEHGTRSGGRTDAETIQRREGVRAELDAGADLADRFALLEQLDLDAEPGEHQRGGEPTDATADHDDLLV